ncbi:MAG: hypothetical protein WDO24_23345 [Pseudomonadota bacterium]
MGARAVLFQPDDRADAARRAVRGLDRARPGILRREHDASSYAALASFAKIRKLWVLVAPEPLQPDRAHVAYLDDISVNQAVTGEPIDWAYAGGLLRLYPIPNGFYPLGFEAIQRFAALANPTDANPWTRTPTT